MPKIKKSSVKKFRSYPTLKIFKYINSDVFHIEIYVGTKINFIEDKRIISGVLRHSLKTKNIRDAEQKSKQIYRQVFNKIDSGEIQKTEFNFDKDIVSSYFNSRQKI